MEFIKAMRSAAFSMGRAKLIALALMGLISALSVSLVSCQNGAPTVGSADDMPFVAVTQMAEQPSFNAVRDRLKDTLADAGYTEGKSLRWEWLSAKHNPVRAMQIADKYAKARPDVIVAIALPSAKAAVAATKNIPIIFSAITDPAGEKLVKNLGRPGGNVSGVSDRPPIGQYLALIKEILPKAKTLGVIYNAKEDGSVSFIDLLKAEASEQGFTEVKEANVAASSEVAEASRQLVGSVDAIYVSADKTVGTALESVIQVGQDNDMPVFSGDAEAVKKGAITGLSFNYDDIGRQTGDMVIQVLKGGRPGDLPVKFVEAMQLSVNPASAKAMGVTIPETVIKRASEVVK